MKKLKQLVHQLFRFSMVGVSCFGIDYGLMIFFTEFTSMSYFLSSGLSFTIATLINYLLSMRFVFRGKEDMNRLTELIIFVVLSVIGLGLNQMIMWIIVEQIHIHYMLAKIFSALIVTIYNFISRKIFLE